MEAPPFSIVNKPDQHAFVMAGKKTLFLVHLTMMDMEDHMYQVVLQASIPEYAMDIYRKDAEEHPEAGYYLGNSAKELMTNPEFGSGRRKTFLGNIFRGVPRHPKAYGWPWKGVDPVVPDVLVTVDRVVHYRHFDLNLKYPKNLTYFLFGAGSEAHLYHYEVKQPDFDNVVTLKESPDWLPETQLEAGVFVNFPDYPARPKHHPKVYCKPPLEEGVYDVQYGGQGPRLKINVDRNLWYATYVTNTNDPCAED